MGGYIRMDKDLEDDPRVLRLADLLAAESGIDRALARNAVIGGLYRLWRYGDTHLGRYNRFKSPLHGAARIAEVTALPLEVLRQFPPEWFREHADGTVELPEYAAKNNLIDRDLRREKGRERVRRFRARQRESAQNGNGTAGVTREALHRYPSVTTGTGTGPGTGTETSETGTGPVDRSDSLASPASPLARREPLNLDPAPCEPSTPQGWERGAAAAREAARGKPTPPDEIERRRQAAASFAERHGAEAKP